jgi:hypothetical protein
MQHPYLQVTACQACGGSGQTFTPCGTCGGDGRVRRSKRISLRVPAGVDSGGALYNVNPNNVLRNRHFVVNGRRLCLLIRGSCACLGAWDRTLTWAAPS